jgi:hypothetical protein
MSRTHRRTTDERLHAAAQDAFTAEGAPPSEANSDDLERDMKELFVSFDGVQYVYDGFRYDRLSDAMAYARLMRSRAPEFDGSTTRPARRDHPPLTEAERTAMRALGIERVGHSFHFESFRYDRLSDAVAYATHSRAVAPTDRG